MKSLLLAQILSVLLVVDVIQGQNVSFTHQKKDRETMHRDSQLLSGLQQLTLQLTTLDSDMQRQGSRLDEVARGVTRLDSQRAELLATLDRSESRVLQTLDDIKGESRRFITLQDVMREDIEKLKQNQILHKAALEEQMRQINSNMNNMRMSALTDSKSESTDLLSHLQVLQTTLSALRRMVDSLQADVQIIKRNVTSLTNTTKNLVDFEKESVLTRTHFDSSMQMYLDQNSENHQANCFSMNQTETLPQDCYEIKQNTGSESGIYRIRPKYSARPIFVFCDMETEDGGWTVFQRRLDGSVDFLRGWQDYKHGFGNIGGEFWLGNENLHLLTNQDSYELRVDLEDFEENAAFAKYRAFAIGSEREKYKLKVLGAFDGGDAGDGLTYHAGMSFSTVDADNDPWDGGHCARDHAGGWWYNQCDASNLNGRYLRGINPHEYQGVYWHEWQGPSYSLKASRMMLRPGTRSQSSTRTTTTERPSLYFVEDEDGVIHTTW